MALQLPVTDLALVEPALGEETLHHDADFVAWDDAFDAVRDTVNFGIRQLNHVGAGLPLLPEESLEELLVQPLAGDCASSSGRTPTPPGSPPGRSATGAARWAC